jgi:hypothetical protein
MLKSLAALFIYRLVMAYRDHPYIQIAAAVVVLFFGLAFAAGVIDWFLEKRKDKDKLI